MKVLKNSYNVLTILIEQPLSNNTPTVIGTNEDYEMIKKMTAKSGILRIRCKFGGPSGIDIFGTCAVNPWVGEDKLEVTAISGVGGSLGAFIGTLEPSDDGLKGTLTGNPIS